MTIPQKTPGALQLATFLASNPQAVKSVITQAGSVPVKSPAFSEQNDSAASAVQKPKPFTAPMVAPKPVPRQAQQNTTAGANVAGAASLFADGYDFGDISKTILGILTPSAQKLKNNIADPEGVMAQIQAMPNTKPAVLAPPPPSAEVVAAKKALADFEENPGMDLSDFRNYDKYKAKHEELQNAVKAAEREQLAGQNKKPEVPQTEAPKLTLAQVQTQYDQAAADLEAYKKAHAQGPGQGEYQMDIDNTIYNMENRVDFLKNKLDQMKSQQITDKDMAEIEKLPPEARKQLEALVNWDSTASYYDAFSNGGVNSSFLMDKAKVQQQAWDSLQKMGYSREKIDQYVSSLSRATNARNAEDMAASSKELADNHGKLGSLLSVAVGAGAGIAGSLEAGTSAITHMLGGGDNRYKTDDPNKPGFAPGMFTEGVRGEVSENIKEKHPGAGGKALDALYRASMSAADNLIRVAASPGGKAFTMGLMATGSFQDSYREATTRGASPEKAMLMGVVDAAIEEITEKFSVDRLLDDSITVDSIGKLVKSALTQGGVEASEEELGFVLNLIADSAIMGNQSEVRTNINEMVANGASYEEAEKAALRQTLMQALDTAATSALSGSMMDVASRGRGAADGTAQRINDWVNQYFHEKAERPLGPVREDATKSSQGKTAAANAKDGETQNSEAKYSLRDAEIPTRENLNQKPPMQVVDISKPKTTGTFKERRGDIVKNAQEAIKKPYLNKDTGKMVFITEKSYTHSFNNLGGLQLNAVEHLPELIENAVLTSSAKPTHGSEYTDGVYTFFAAAKGEAVMPVKLTVKEYTYSGQDLPKNIKAFFENNPQNYASSYDTVVLGVEKIEESPSGSAKDMNQNGSFLSPQELSTINVSDLLDRVKGDAEKYIPKLCAVNRYDPTSRNQSSALLILTLR